MIPNPKSFNSWSAGSYGDILLIARDEDGVVVDLSDPDTIIVWAIADSENSSPLTSKSYPASGIAFVTDGSDGKFNVAMSGVTDSLDGTYYQEAIARINDEWKLIVAGTLRVAPTIL